MNTSLGVFGLVTSVFVVLGLRRPSDRQVGAFARAYAVPVTAETSSLIRFGVARLRRWRYIGAAVGSLVVLVESYIVDSQLSVGRFAVAHVFGFAVGAVISEIRRPQRHAAPIAAAWPERRRLSHFVTPWSYRIVAGVGAVVAAYLALIAINRGFDIAEVEDPREAIGRAGMLWLALGWAGLAVFCVIALRRLTVAPEQIATRAQHVVNRAIRSAALITVLGATLMGFCLIGSVIVWPIVGGDGSAPQIIRWMNTLAYFSILMGVPCGWLIAVNSLPNIGTYLRVPRVADEPVAQVAGS